jgi:hypothetical protein
MKNRSLARRQMSFRCITGWQGVKGVDACIHILFFLAKKVTYSFCVLVFSVRFLHLDS